MFKRHFPSDTTPAATHLKRGLLLAVMALSITGCETSSMPEARYPIYMQNRPVAAGPSAAPAEPAPAYQAPAYLAPVPAVGEVSSSDLPPPPPPSIIRPSVVATTPAPKPWVAPKPLTATKPAPLAPVGASGSYVYAYVMQAHDTLFGVSRRFGVPIKSIFDANGLTVNSAVSVGQRILLPASAKDNGAEERASGTGLIRVAVKAAEPVIVDPPGLKPEPTPVVQPQPAPQPQPLPQPVPGAKFPKAGDIATIGRGMFIWPVRGSTLVKYGQLGPNVRNDGINIAADRGAPVVAAAEGYVLIVLTNSNQTAKDLGNTVYIQNGNGWYTGYSHLDTITVKQNQRVKQGQVIGTVGQTGAVSSPQLHFEIRYTPSKEIAKPIDPNLVLPAGR